MIKSIVLLVALQFTPVVVAHKFYVSHYRIDYKSRDKTMQVTAKVFTDDLEKALRTFHHDNSIRLPARDTIQNSDSLIEAYFRKNFYLTQDDQVKLWSWVGKEFEYDATWIYIEQKNISSSELPLHTLHCKVLTEQFDDQKNIIDLRFGREKATHILTKSSTALKLID